MKLDIAVDSKKQQPAKTPARRSTRSENLISPVKEVKLAWWEEQALYDRMYEARVYKHNTFFGYRSTVAERWHGIDNSEAASTARSFDPKDVAIIDEHIDWHTPFYRVPKTHKEKQEDARIKAEAEAEWSIRQEVQSHYSPVVAPSYSLYWPKDYREVIK